MQWIITLKEIIHFKESVTFIHCIWKKTTTKKQKTLPVRVSTNAYNYFLYSCSNSQVKNRPFIYPEYSVTILFHEVSNLGKLIMFIFFGSTAEKGLGRFVPIKWGQMQCVFFLRNWCGPHILMNLFLCYSYFTCENLE